jgi:phage host-nuclease inhibitor protein Gam
MLSGTIGWRTTPPAVKPAKGFTWQSVLEVLKEQGRTEFVRLKEEINREALLAARDTEDLRPLHVRVEQVDEFFVEPKLTDVSGREVAAG